MVGKLALLTWVKMYPKSYYITFLYKTKQLDQYPITTTRVTLD